MNETGIEWTDVTWNPVTGCTKVSPGCDHCYADSIATRFAGSKAWPNGFDVTLRPERLGQPFKLAKPSRVFVNSMSDLFHDAVPDDYIAKVWAVMARTPQHTYQILTKRHARLDSLLNSRGFANLVLDEWGSGSPLLWPLSNVWLGVSAEDQKWADIRIPHLLRAPAMVRFVSVEPLLGPVDLTPWLDRDQDPFAGGYHFGPGQPVFGSWEPDEFTISYYAETLDWVIVGGESGAGARPMHPAWARHLRDQCTAAGVAFLFKQWGSHDEHGKRMSKHAAGRVLDGRTWDEYPASVAANFSSGEVGA